MISALTLKPKCEQRVQTGYPWVYSNELSALPDLPAGSIVRITSARGQALGYGFYNRQSLIAVRVIGPDAPTPELWQARLTQALAHRQAQFETPYYRLTHSEADGLPGLIIDRYGDVAVVQENSAGAQSIRETVLNWLNDNGMPHVIAKNDSTSRQHEGLLSDVSVLAGNPPAEIAVPQHGLTYFAAPLAGQKTGFFFDQRANRDVAAKLAMGKTVLDLYSHVGGFGLACAATGAASVMLVDSAAPALEAATKSIANSNLKNVTTNRADVFDLLPELIAGKQRYDVVLADPPAFIKSKKDFATGKRGYEKLAKLCAQLVNPGGVLMLASCSYHMPLAELQIALAKGLNAANRTGQIFYTGFADTDHPQHLSLPETAYLKALFVRMLD